MNAEIVLGTVSSLTEAARWLGYTYFHVRQLKNPLAYGITWEELLQDPDLFDKRRALCLKAAQTLDNCKMIRYDDVSETFYSTDFGRIAAYYYINHGTLRVFNELLDKQRYSVEEDSAILDTMTEAAEFEQIRIREEEMTTLDEIHDYCPFSTKLGVNSHQGKTKILIQAFISQARLQASSLTADTHYISQNVPRIIRGIFEIAQLRGWSSLMRRLLSWGKMVDKRMWDSQHPLRQFMGYEKLLTKEIIMKLESKNITVDRLLEMEPAEIGALLRVPKMGKVISQLVSYLPSLELNAHIQPITPTVLRITVTLYPNFQWRDAIHGQAEPWWIWLEENETDQIYHTEHVILTKKQYFEILTSHQPLKLVFSIPISSDHHISHFLVRAESDKWIGADNVYTINFHSIHLLPVSLHPQHTDLLDLTPLPTSALQNPSYQQLYPFSHFNPIQTQVFHTMYHQNTNILLGSPTGSGKTICAELAMLQLFSNEPHLKVVYIAPLKALVRERIKDWKAKFGGKLGKRVVELTGDQTPTVDTLLRADIVTTTPEKWDGISRNWQSRSYVKHVGLVIIDEIHLLGEVRGPVLEVIVSRMRYISNSTQTPIRIIGLSTAIANAPDLASWLGIDCIQGLFNFRPSVRPVPLEVHIAGYPGKHYCPRMATMNKPVYNAILTHSITKPVLVFVSSRRQTRLTALDLISFAVNDGYPQRWLHMAEEELNIVLDVVQEVNLAHTLQFGIAIHHAGLTDKERAIAEYLFEHNKIQILIATSTLAWGINLPAHLVIIKGTEYFDGASKKYVDFPVTDVLQMMGRAGRPQFDKEGRAVILVHEPKKKFYQRFLYEPFPVESHLPEVMTNHLNAEIVSGSIKTKQDAMDYLTWTYYFRRLLENPSYYNLAIPSDATRHDIFSSVSEFLSRQIDQALIELDLSSCVEIIEETEQKVKEKSENIEETDHYWKSKSMLNHSTTVHTRISPLFLGKISSYYYLDHRTVRLFNEEINEDQILDIRDVAQLLCASQEYSEFCVRHNEDKINEELSKELPWEVAHDSYDSPHTKVFLLLQAHFSRLKLPIVDYITDTKSVLDQAVRIIQAIVDISAEKGCLYTCLNAMHLQEMVMQGHWIDQNSLLCLPHTTSLAIDNLDRLYGIECLPQLFVYSEKQLLEIFSTFNSKQSNEILTSCRKFPFVKMKHTVEFQVNNIKMFHPGTLVPANTSNVRITITLERTNEYITKGKTAFTPRYPKDKQEGWWLIIADSERGELFALRRVSLIRKCTTSLLLNLEDIEGAIELKKNRKVFRLTLYLMSDSYLALNQQYPCTIFQSV